MNPTRQGNSTLDLPDLEAQWDHNASGTNRPRPPLLVKLTGYRLLNMITVLAFGIAKAITSYQGKSTVPTTLDWILGVVLGLLLYGSSFYESAQPPVWEWFYHEDYSPAISQIPTSSVLVPDVDVDVDHSAPMPFDSSLSGESEPEEETPMLGRGHPAGRRWSPRRHSPYDDSDKYLWSESSPESDEGYDDESDD
ncbi:hypothetical protein BV25DRAFT_1916862 [Artomyces pyxidatus]|uniref:Uncharacterized protein n=1 Tax=Artomyces pyxidatus TaxID=48021 RepID=A0ACB8T014_9AGAM|nr:hypothetical protein BV25DRAFT_1916862 [Artomyces pyxidatus]